MAKIGKNVLMKLQKEILEYVIDTSDDAYCDWIREAVDSNFHIYWEAVIDPNYELAAKFHDLDKDGDDQQERLSLPEYEALQESIKEAIINRMTE